MEQHKQRKPTARECEYLKRAGRDANGTVPGGMTARLREAMLRAGLMFAEDRDGFAIPVEEAISGAVITRLGITPAGRAAVLSSAQALALATRVDTDGRFHTGVPWPTVQALAGLGLAEYRDELGRVQPHDGDTGVSGPVNSAFRTALGAEVAIHAQPAA